MIPYRTPRERVVLPDWVPLGDTALLVSRTPLLDPGPIGPGLAHLSYRDALQVAAELGARLPSREELLELHRVAAAAGTELAPVVLPGADPELVAQGARPGDPAMVSFDWCRRHDERVLAQIAALSVPRTPMANAGKHWRAGAPAGLAGLCGWWVAHVERYGATGRSGPGFVQEGEGWPHDDGHFDYGTTTVLVRGAA